MIVELPETTESVRLCRGRFGTFLIFLGAEIIAGSILLLFIHPSIQAKRVKTEDKPWQKSVGKLTTVRSGLIVKKPSVVCTTATAANSATPAVAAILTTASPAKVLVDVTPKGLSMIGDYGSDSNSGEE